MLKKYPLSDHSTPHVDRNAKPCKYRSVINASVIIVEGASYRGAGPFSGTFELVFPEKDPRLFQKKLCAEVVCAWHGKKPLTSYPHIQLLSGWEAVHGYSGEVVDNIA